MSKALTVLAVGGVFVALYALWRKSQGQPVLPTASAETSDAAKAAGVDMAAEKTETTPTSANVQNAKPKKPTFVQINEGTRSAGYYDDAGNWHYGKVPAGHGYELGEQIKNEAPKVAIAVAAGGAAVALQTLKKTQGYAVPKIAVKKEPSGLIKQTIEPRTGAEIAKPKTGIPIKETIGTGATQRVTAVQVPKPLEVPKVPAIKPTATVATAAKVGSTAARVASKALLPVGVALSAYDLADRAQKKGAENLDIGDAVAAASGLGGWGIRNVLPQPLKDVAKTKIADIPKALAKIAPKPTANKTGKERAAVQLAARAKAKPAVKPTPKKTTKANASVVRKVVKKK